MENRAFEATSLVPRSITRTFERFVQQLVSGSERKAIQEFRISRYQVLVSVRCLVDLILIPLLVNILGKNLILQPLTQHLWNSHQHDIFLNSHQEKRALVEMHDFSEMLFFESLILEERDIPFTSQGDLLEKGCWQTIGVEDRQRAGLSKQGLPDPISKENAPFSEPHTTFCRSEVVGKQSLPRESYLQQRMQEKTYQLAIFYNQQSIVAVTNLLGDLFTIFTVVLLFLLMKPQVIILKSFLSESIYSLNDTTKSFLIILLTDLLVGFHSPRGWEIVFETALRHFGLPEDPDFVFLIVATLPVILDTVFKYWIFRYLNKISPSTVATYHSMIE